MAVRLAPTMTTSLMGSSGCVGPARPASPDYRPKPRGCCSAAFSWCRGTQRCDGRRDRLQHGPLAHAPTACPATNPGALMDKPFPAHHPLPRVSLLLPGAVALALAACGGGGGRHVQGGGGGAKGFYTLGVLKEIEAMVGCPLHQKFDLVFGTSTGAIIASLIALGHDVDSILQLYRKHVPTVMSQKTAPARSQALKNLAREVFGNATFNDVKTGVGIVTAKWLTERPMIFKGSGDCSAVDWTFLGGTIANWSFVWFVIFIVVILAMLFGINPAELIALERDPSVPCY